MKFSTDGNYVDNSHSGGISIAVKEDGTLYETGKQLSTGREFTNHPSTGFEFSTLQIPYFEAAKELVLRAHQCLYSINSVGWDVAITPYGPVIVEGNVHWGMDESLALLPQQQSQEEYEKYEKLYGGTP